MTDRRSRILIIDDDEGFCRLVSKHLERIDYEVVCTYSATEGLDVYNNSDFDVVILDHVLPEQDGITLLASLRAKPNPPPVVYLTGSEESRVAVAALKAGASEYVIKDLEGEFIILLEKAVNSAIFSAAIKRAKDVAEEQVRIARDEYRALAEERALLLREVNHRVSNSLQLIASLLHFQGDATNSADVKAALKEANGRVLAVARVHRSLYTSLDVRFVSLNEYLSALIDDLQDVSAGAANGSAITIAADPVQVGPDTAVAVGIIATELVLNAMKHAYPGGRGPIRVNLKAKAAQIELIVEDDGVGAVRDDKSGRPGLGQRIIAGMAEKLGGVIERNHDHSGTCVKLAFPRGEEADQQNAGNSKMAAG